MSWKIRTQRSSSTALLHRGDCATYPDQVGLISRADALVALAEPDIELCEAGRPQTGLLNWPTRASVPAPPLEDREDAGRSAWTCPAQPLHPTRLFRHYCVHLSAWSETNSVKVRGGWPVRSSTAVLTWSSRPVFIARSTAARASANWAGIPEAR